MSERDGAFSAYFVARSDAMRGTAYLLCGDWHRAEDLVQTAFTKVGVLTSTPTPGVQGGYDQWAVYRHPDGAIVALAQAVHFDESDPRWPALTELPFSTRDLAYLATDSRFHIG